MNGADPRGCGDSREVGGIYMESGSSGGEGIPMSMLIKDPISLFDVESVGLSPVGVKLVEIDGITHVFDWVGATHYPNAADFLEESIRLGLSRRIPRTADFSKLTAESRLILVHPKAYIEAPDSYWDCRPIPCPTGFHPDSNERPGISEAGKLWVVGDPGSTDGLPMEGDLPLWAPFPVAAFNSVGRRSMPAFDYNLGERPAGSKDVVFRPGIVMVAAIERLSVVNNPYDEVGTAETVEWVNSSPLLVSLDDE